MAAVAVAVCILGVGSAGPGSGPAVCARYAVKGRAHGLHRDASARGWSEPRLAPPSLVHGLPLRLRGGGGEVGGAGGSGKDARSAETRSDSPGSLGFTRSPSPNLENAALAADATGRTGSGSLSPGGPWTRSSSPRALLIAMCAWESLHTVAVGGVAPHVTELAAGLARRGNEVHLFVRAGYDMSQARYEVIHDVHVHRVPIELSSDFVEECNNMCNAFVFHMREAEEHMETEFDLVHVHDWLCAKALVQMKTARRRCVFTCHSTEYGRAGKTSWDELDDLSRRIVAIESEACEYSDKVIVVSATFSDEVKEHYFAGRHRPTKNAKLRMVYNGIHAHTFQGNVDEAEVKGRYGIWGGAPVILSVGRLIPQKGPDILIGALPKLLETNSDAVAVFVGDGHMRHYLEKQVVKSKLYMRHYLEKQVVKSKL